MSRNLAAALLLLLIISAGAAAKPPDKISYNRDIRPVLSDNCFFCHGPDPNKRKGKMRLDIREEALAKVAFVPGKPAESELIKRIFAAGTDDLMPPAASHKVLSPAQKELFRRWIAQGAVYEKHWAYVPPVKPPVPGLFSGVRPSSVAAASARTNGDGMSSRLPRPHAAATEDGRTPPASAAIDYLVQKRLREVGLKPSPEADRRTLARRLSFDLIGLPPTPEDVAAFEQNKSADAYDKLVDKLLASPHYGERMAIGWLDFVRFADTIGYHSDAPRNVWPYRDYVIKAFNENKRYDQFTREQLAGDLLPHSGLEQKVGSAFNRLLLTTEEGGAQPKDYEARMFTDRVRAVSTVWLGQTIGCAQCHDHKFDPITSRDFYSLAAVFADIREPSVGRREDGMGVPDAKQAAELAKLDAEVTRRQQDYDAPRRELAAKWEAAALEAIAAETHWTVLAPEKMISEAGVKLTADTNHIISAENEPKDGKDTYRITIKTSLKDVAGFRLEALSEDKLPGQGPGRAADGNFVLTEFSVEDANTNRIVLSEATATFETAGFPAAAALDGNQQTTNGWAIKGVTGVEQAIYFATKGGVRPSSVAAGSTRVAALDLQKPARVSNVAAPEDGRTPLNTNQGEGESPPASSASAAVVSTVTFVIQQTSGGNQVLGRFRLSATTNAAAVRAPKAALPRSDIAKLLQTPGDNRTKEQQQRLATFQRSAAPELMDERRRLAEAKKAGTDFEATFARCLVSVVADEPRTVRILPRGDFMNETGDIVPPALPAYLTVSTTKVAGRRLNRLDLAEWLVSRENPLVARVFVNRLWKQFFGIGLAKVLDDFGMQGEPPVNPELLDWLACEFMDSGWDVKHMVRLIATSRAYKQVSTASKKLQTRDPYNRYVARQSRWRIEAELVRDNALSVAGLLVPKIGGPSVKPYQPDGYWENLNFPVRTYEADAGEGQYRRGLYTWWQRSFLHPSLLAFDAPSREECTAERNRSNIPQQALALLNDPTYVEAARAFAARILKAGGADTASRIKWAWRQALARAPRPDELTTVRALLDQHLAEYRRDPQAAAALLKVGLSHAPADLDPSELAAWTNIARVILNLHETITRS